MSFHVPECLRVLSNQFPPGDATNGFFELPGVGLRMIASDGGGWEHVSISRADRCPSWEEMCAVKALFWDAEDCVMQLHVPESEWVNCHPFCLHLWRPARAAIPQPPSFMVGPKKVRA